nr:aminopeptidase [Lachnospiraceae bacterium]
METKNAWENYTLKQAGEAEAFAADYIDFLSTCKTERECVDRIVCEAEKAGYKELEGLIKDGKKVKTGDKIYSVWMNKSVALFNIGQRPINEGINILGAHIDSPRLDIKQNPLYEDSGIAYLDTHYYGGVKKYQWVTIPLALHGVIVKKDGTTVIVNIGEDEDDPVFFVSDLLIHLAQEQLDKKAAKVIEGEALDIIIGNRPLVLRGRNKAENADNKDKDKVKKNILDILKKNYGVEEEDFLSAELEVVPAGRAREAGLDKSMILGYGHDDRVCAYPSLMAMLETKTVKRTACCILVDKEEIGSVGATGMKSHFFENSLAEIMALMGDYSELELRRTLAASCMLSS